MAHGVLGADVGRLVQGNRDADPGPRVGGFPTEGQTEAESWGALCERFLGELEQAAALTRDAELLRKPVRCPSLPGCPDAVMTVQEQLESLAAHDVTCPPKARPFRTGVLS